MESIFRLIHKLGPAGIVLKAIFAALVADGLLLAFILLRRSYRKRYFSGCARSGARGRGGASAEFSACQRVAADAHL